jgi:8-oxo-dGTP pyrophosphatase MutT (NUDIX family)
MNASAGSLPSSRDVLAKLDRRIPDAVAKHLEASAATQAVPPQLAVSVVLLRDDPAAGLQTYVLHRHARMPFAAGMAVFPGGRLDDVDGQFPASGMAGDNEPTGLAPALRRCGIREMAEETGVRLQTDELYPWAHWITPECEPRRYDTYFYLAELPAGQHATDISGETSRAEWRSAADVLRAADHGELAVMPPTRATLIELREFGSVAQARAACRGRRVETIVPRPVREEDGWMFDYDAFPDTSRSSQGDR